MTVAFVSVSISNFNFFPTLAAWGHWVNHIGGLVRGAYNVYREKRGEV
jgi:hypothetical protein